MSERQLDPTPDHETLKVLRDAGVLSSVAFWRGIRGISEPQDWARWAARLCLLIGSTLVLAAVVFFFAFNWDALGRMQKLGLLQAVTVGALVAGQIVGFRRIGGQLLLMAAAIFVGVSFAVFGQVYQTGADAFSFFGMWSLCIAPWVVAGAFAPLWVLWFVLVNLTICFFWAQVGQFQTELHYSYLCISLTMINGAGLVAREQLTARFDWLAGHWLRPLFLLGTLTPLLIPALDLVFHIPSEGAYALMLSSVIWLLCLCTAHLYFTRKQFDSTAICIVLGQAAIYLATLIGKMLEEMNLYNSGVGFLLMALIIGAITTLIVQLLRWLKHRYAQREREQP